MLTHHLRAGRWPRLAAMLLIAAAIAIVAQVSTATSASAATYYVSPTGNDAANGSASAPWKTFARAWKGMQAGDTLMIYDGTYTETIQPLVAGKPGAPVTIKAVNDGKVIVDGRGVDIPLKLGDTWPGDNRSYITVEGIVVKNGTEAAVRIRGDHMILRRVSAYDAALRMNSSVIAVVWANDILLEDVVAAGTGRKSILIFTSERVTVRRAFTQWKAWDGMTADTCAMGWPAGNGINPYNSKYVTVENAIVTGPVADAGLRITANEDSVYSPGMKVLGSIVIGAGINADGSQHAYPLPSNPACPLPGGGIPYVAAAWGMGVYGQGDVPGPVFRDVLSVGNAGWGFASIKPFGTGVHEGTLDHATVLDSNIYPGKPEEKGQLGTYSGFTVTNSKIPGYQDGEGARFSNRYVDGNLTDQALWPWPMEERVQAEMGQSVAQAVAKYVNISGYSIRLAQPVLRIQSGQEATLSVAVSTFGQFSGNVTVSVSSTEGDLAIDPATAQVAASSGAAGNVSFRLRPSAQTKLYPLQITAKADNNPAITRQAWLAVSAQSLFLPSIEK